VNNTVARTAGLLWVAGLPPLAGLAGEAYTQAAVFLPGYRVACVVCAAALFVAGALAATVGRPP
jgi:formate hydrogenlyase subunit 3/multisubunit Na+/H+ antiporter MnhD subunit